MDGERGINIAVEGTMTISNVGEQIVMTLFMIYEIPNRSVKI
jgi:hypothetical protein